MGGVRTGVKVVVNSAAARAASEAIAASSACVTLPSISITTVLTVLVARVRLTPVPTRPSDVAFMAGAISSFAVSAFETHSSFVIAIPALCSRRAAPLSSRSVEAMIHAGRPTSHARCSTAAMSAASCDAFHSKGDVSVSWSTRRTSTVEIVTSPGRLLASEEAAAFTSLALTTAPRHVRCASNEAEMGGELGGGVGGGASGGGLGGDHEHRINASVGGDSLTPLMRISKLSLIAPLPSTMKDVAASPSPSSSASPFVTPSSRQARHEGKERESAWAGSQGEGRTRA